MHTNDSSFCRWVFFLKSYLFTLLRLTPEGDYEKIRTFSKMINSQEECINNARLFNSESYIAIKEKKNGRTVIVTLI